jgi:hypothetical protein
MVFTTRVIAPQVNPVLLESALRALWHGRNAHTAHRVIARALIRRDIALLRECRAA